MIDSLTQSEAEALIAVRKVPESDKAFRIPALGGKVAIPLITELGTEGFLLDIWRNKINLLKRMHQTRVHQSIVLVRIDLGGSPHRNPDDEEIPCPHIHVYRQGYGDKWATPLPVDIFPRPDDLLGTLDDFAAYCNIGLPTITEPLL